MAEDTMSTAVSAGKEVAFEPGITDTDGGGLSTTAQSIEHSR